MGFEISPSPVRATRLRWPILAFAAVIMLVVGAAVSTQAPTPQPSATPGVAAAPALGQLGALLTPSEALARTLPAQVACRQLDASTCQSLAQAALAVLPADAPPILTVTVYRSLLCRDDLDCPPARLASSGAPSGSVVVGFADGGPDAWVDVVTVPTADLEAWIIR